MLILTVEMMGAMWRMGDGAGLAYWQVHHSLMRAGTCELLHGNLWQN